MALTNNTKFRRVNVTINKKVNGSLQTSAGFPLEHSLTNAFGGFAAITDADLAIISDADYTSRLNAFYDYLETTYSFFQRSQMLNPSSGIDAILCPLTNDSAPVVTASGPPILSFGPLGTSLIWNVSVTEVVTQDTSYYFDANVRDSSGNLIRTETLYGIIRQGRNDHDSFADDGHSIYFPEAENPAMQPLMAEFVPGSIVFNV